MATDDVDTVLAGGIVLTVDDQRRTLDPGAVAVAGDRIVEVGDREEVLDSYPNADRISLEGSVIMPGLVDSHGHAGHAMTKNLAVTEGEWLEVVEDVYFRGSDERFWRLDGYIAALEHLEVGVTTSISFPGSKPRVDDPRYASAAAEGYADLGLRHIVNLGPPNLSYPIHYRDVESGEDLSVDLDHAFETTEAVIEDLDGQADGRLSVFVGPSSLVPEFETDDEEVLSGFGLQHSSGSASAHSIEVMERAVELADTHETNIQVHAYSGQIKAAAESVPDILGPHLSLAHATGISDEEVEILAETGTHVSHGPLTNSYANARFPLVEAMDAGVNVAISTDGAAPDRSFDLLSQGRIAAQLQRVHFEDTSLLPPGKVIEMMTLDAARALGMDDEIGSLEAGKKADIIAVDFRTPRLQPAYRHAERLVHYATGQDVEFVMVDGTVLRENQPLESAVSVDVDEIIDDAVDAATDAFRRVDVERYAEANPAIWGGVRGQ